jgi:putative membrane protein
MGTRVPATRAARKELIDMNSCQFIAVATFALFVPLIGVARAEPASDADKAFVAKVSQGGMYEVEASKLAVQRASAQDVKDVAATEVHDHELVNKKLKKIADAADVPVAAELNAEFQDRLAKLKDTAASDFDAAYIDDMKQIHDKDEKLFAKEAEEGTGDFKIFAQETDKIVKRHIGSLHGTD